MLSKKFAKRLLVAFLFLASALPGVSAAHGVEEIIHFEYGKSEIRPQSIALLDNLIALLGFHFEVVKFAINGHADSEEAKLNAMKLSRRRAEAVKAYFIKNGIDPNRLTTNAYGDTRPIATNQTVEGRARNRRVDFHIAETKDPPASPKIDLCPGTNQDGADTKETRENQSRKAKHIQRPGINIVIFQKQGASQADCLGKSAYWTPSIEDVIAAEPGIKACVQKYCCVQPENNSKSTDKRLISLEIQNRQYTGVIYQNRKLLWIDYKAYPEADWTAKPFDRTCIYNTDSWRLLYDTSDGNCYNYCRSATIE